MTAEVPDLVLRGGSVVDVEAGTVQPGLDVHLRGGVVTAVEASGGSTGSALVVDLDGRFVAPGLIDMHVHSTLNPGAGARTEDSVVGRALLAAANLARALRAGVTSVRDVGTADDEAFELKRAWQNGRLDGPRMFVAGQALTAVGGHGNEYGTTLGLEVTGEVEIVRSVRRLAASGADVIKVIVNGPPTPAELGHDEVRAVVTAAHACGLRVAAHAQMDRDVLDRAVGAGADTIEHGLGISDEQIRQLADRRGFLTPTLAVYESIGRNVEFFGGPDSPFVVQALRDVAEYKPVVRAAHEAGVRILAGTDAGNPSVDFGSIHEELALLADDCGLGTLTALRAATTNAAAALDRPDLGVVREGATGDLVVLDGNPLDDLGALASPALVVQARSGRSVLRDRDAATGASGSTTMPRGRATSRAVPRTTTSQGADPRRSDA